MTLGIMQPYFLPYIGYWQLLSAVDRFVVYDNIQYTKQGWVNRNRFLRNGADAQFTLPLRRGSALLDIADRAIADDFDPGSLLRPLASAYRKAPYYAEVFPVVESIVAAPHRNLFDYLLHGIVVTADHLGIRTPILASSKVAIDHGLKSERKVVALCQALGETRYLNPIGGRELYSRSVFAASGIDLQFVQSRPIAYRQFGDAFVPALSIVDVLMFNAKDAVQRMLCEYDLVS